MTKKNKHSSLRAPLSGETRKLVEELYTAQRVLMPDEPCTPGQDPTHFVVAKLVSHLDKKAWAELCSLTKSPIFIEALAEDMVAMESKSEDEMDAGEVASSLLSPRDVLLQSSQKTAQDTEHSSQQDIPTKEKQNASKLHSTCIQMPSSQEKIASMLELEPERLSEQLSEQFSGQMAGHLSELEQAAPSMQWMRHLLLSASFLRQLKQEISRAKRGAAPLALVRFAIVDESAFSLERATRILHMAIEKHGEDCDTLGVLDIKNFALILPGARSFKAQSIVEDILDECRHNSLTLRAGIAVHTGNECSIQKFLEHAAAALEQALSQKVALFMYKKPHESLEAKRTLVLGHEKRFLFGPIDEE